MKKKWKRQMAIVMTATLLCGFYPLSGVKTWASEERTEKITVTSTPSNAMKVEPVVYAEEQKEEIKKTIEYTEQGQTILYLDKGSVELSEKEVSGYNKDGSWITEVNDKGYYITVTEKGADTSGKSIKISKNNQVCLGDIHGGNLNCYQVNQLSISGEVVLDDIIASRIPFLQGKGEDAVFDIGKEKIETLGEIKISNLQLKASAVKSGILTVENSKIYADEVSSVEGMMFIDIGRMPGVLTCTGSSIYAQKSFEINRGKIENSTIETSAFSMELRDIDASAFQDMDLKQQRMEIKNSYIKADEILISGITDADIINSEINCHNMSVSTERVNVVQRIISGYGEDKQINREIVDHIDDNIQIKFNHSKVNIEDPDAAIIPVETGGYMVSGGLSVSGGTYDHEKKEYTSRALCEIVIQNESEFVLRQGFSMYDFVTVNIDKSTLDIHAFPSNKEDILIPAIEGASSDDQKHINFNLADNVMIADGKVIKWFESHNEWWLESIISESNDMTANSIKIILKSEDSSSSGNSGNSSNSSNNSSSSSSSGSSRRSGGSGGSSRLDNDHALPSYVIKGNWNQNLDGGWSFVDADGNAFVNQWAAVYNPYADTAAGQENYDWFYFDLNGNMMTGWIQDGEGNYYYLNPLSDGTKGRMLTGWTWIADEFGTQRCYYFNPISDGYRGKMLRNTVIEGSMVNENGCWTENGVVQTK